MQHRWVRDQAGQKIGREIVGPLPEPQVPTVYREICQGQQIVAEYQNARHGRPCEEVKPLQLPREKIEDWVRRLNEAES